LAAPGVPQKVFAWMFRPDSPFHLKPRFNRNLLGWLWSFMTHCNQKHRDRSLPILGDLSQASAALYRDFARDPNLDFDHGDDGLLHIANTNKGFADLVSEAELHNAIGVKGTIVTSEEIPDYLPGLRTHVSGAVFYPEDQHVNPAKFVTQLVDQLPGENVSLHEETEVTGFNESGGRLASVETTKGKFTADHFVLAAGSVSPQLTRQLDIHVPVQPAKGYSITIPKPDGCPPTPLLLTESKVAVTPMGESLRFAGTLELTGHDDRLNLRRVQAIVDAVTQYLPDLKLPQPTEREIWHGFRPCTPDGLPIIGPTRRYNNLILATGHAMIGQTLGPATGLLVAQLIARQDPIVDPTPFSPDRF
jgi:D-amino-acid dehydrogenase